MPTFTNNLVHLRECTPFFYQIAVTSNISSYNLQEAHTLMSGTGFHLTLAYLRLDHYQNGKAFIDIHTLTD